MKQSYKDYTSLDLDSVWARLYRVTFRRDRDDMPSNIFNFWLLAILAVIIFPATALPLAIIRFSKAENEDLQDVWRVFGYIAGALLFTSILCMFFNEDYIFIQVMLWVFFADFLLALYCRISLMAKTVNWVDKTDKINIR